MLTFYVDDTKVQVGYNKLLDISLKDERTQKLMQTEENFETAWINCYLRSASRAASKKFNVKVEAELVSGNSIYDLYNAQSGKLFKKSVQIFSDYWRLDKSEQKKYEDVLKKQR